MSDMIRNYLLMGLPEPEQTRMYDECWSRVETLFRQSGSSPDNFARDDVALKQKTTQPRGDRIYAEFKEYWQPSDQEALAGLLEELVRFAEYVVAVLRPERIESSDLTARARNLAAPQD